MKILLVEVNVSIRNVLRMGLENEGFIIDEVEDGNKGSYIARVNKYDLIILDNVLPGKMGKEVCSDIRQSGLNTPILLLSAKSDVDSKISLLNVGADDYLTKPFSFEELKARIKSILRRPHKIEDIILYAGDLRLNSDTHEVTKDERKIYLTRKEFSLLELFMKNADHVLSRTTIMENVWDMNADPFSNTIETHILSLRRKIGDQNKNLISNIPGRGYKFITPTTIK